MSLINPTVVTLVIALLVLGLAAAAWGPESRPGFCDDYIAQRTV